MFRNVSVVLKHCKRFLSTRTKTNANIFEHFASIGQTENLDLFPKHCKRTTSKQNAVVHFADEIVADVVAKAIARFRIDRLPFIEINPGPCILTKSLLAHVNPAELILLENNEAFYPAQEELQREHPSRVQTHFVKHIWGSGVFHDVLPAQPETRQWDDDVICQLFHSSLSGDTYRFIHDVVLQKRLFAKGRIEMFALLPNYEYLKLTAQPESTFLLYTNVSCLFQILFEYEHLVDIPRTSLLPWINVKDAFGGNIVLDKEVLHLVRIVPRRNLLSIYNREELVLLKFFIDQVLFKRTAYVIPILEKWIPGIGIDLITSDFSRLSADVSRRSIINTNQSQSRLTKFNCFTQCGSLNPHEICTLFDYFRLLAEYKDSSFVTECEEFNRQNAHKKTDTKIQFKKIKRKP